MPSPVAACSAETAAAAQVNKMDSCGMSVNNPAMMNCMAIPVNAMRAAAGRLVALRSADKAHAKSGMISSPNRLCSISAMARPRLARSVNLALRIAGG
jgi:hypothetical protein